jgi:hypothetical protein
MPTFGELNLLDCAGCRFEAGATVPTAANLAGCPHCGKKVAAYVFPAFVRAAAPAPVVGATVIGTESSCFYHAHKRAIVACDVCGRFLCDLCDVEADGEHRCARCIETAVKNTKTTAEKYTYYDTIAIVVVVVGFLLSFAMIITAPIALYLVIRYWNTPISIMPRSRWRFVVAGILAVLQLGGIAILFLLPLLSMMSS